jgi:hypothetical protein
MMRDGKVFALPMLAHPTTGLEFSSLLGLATPKAAEGKGGALGAKLAKERGNHVGLRDQIMDLVASQGKKVTRQNLPTPTTRDYKDGQAEHKRDGVVQTDTVARAIFSGDWGQYAPAIERWETVIGRPAPAPTKPDGRDGSHRLSSAFTEWMMGLPEGWVTGCGLTRNEELKACGNGVVPQQAVLALKMLLDNVPLERERERERTVMLPTPTVSDTFTDNLKSSQQKPGSMHSVTLPQAVRMVSES